MTDVTDLCCIFAGLAGTQVGSGFVVSHLRDGSWSAPAFFKWHAAGGGLTLGVMLCCNSVSHLVRSTNGTPEPCASILCRRSSPSDTSGQSVPTTSAGFCLATGEMPLESSRAETVIVLTADRALAQHRGSCFRLPCALSNSTIFLFQV